MNVLIASGSPWLDFGIEGRVHPLTTLLALLVPSLLFVMVLNSASVQQSVARSGGLFSIVAALMVSLYLAAALSDLFSHAFIDHVEPGIASVSWLFGRGRPLYQDLVTQQRYSVPYGPYLYVFVSLFQTMLGPSVFATKLPCVLSGVLSLLLLFVIIKKVSTPRRALYWTGLAAALLLTFGDVSFWTRPDPFMMFAVVIGLFATTLNGIAGPILLGLSLGVAVNLKADAFLYFLPSLILALRQKWRTPWILSGLVSILAAVALPFIAFHNISLANFLALLKINSQRAFDRPLFSQILHWFAFLFLPVLAAIAYSLTRGGDEFREFFKRQWIYLGSILLAFLAILLPSSLIGAGTHHLVPLIPVIVFFAAGLPPLRWNPASPPRAESLAVLVITSAWVAACLVQGAAGFYRTFQTAVSGNAQARRCADDLKKIIHDHPGAIFLSGAGSSEAYPITFSRYVLAFSGMPIGAEPNVMMDFELTGHGQLDFTTLVKDIEQECNAPVLFVIPKNSPPFSMYSLLPHSPPFSFFRTPSDLPPAPMYSYAQIYPDVFRLDFAKAYTLSNSTEFFDIYVSKVSVGKR